MGLEKLGTTFCRKVTSCIKARVSHIGQSASNITTPHATLPIQPSSLAHDTTQFTRKLIPDNAELFSGTIQRPAFTFDKVNPDSLCLVRMTNFFPEGGEIVSSRIGGGYARPTVHFTLNRSVTEHSLGGNWNTMDYGIILPFSETIAKMPKSKVLGGVKEDFFFLDKVKLPQGSTIVKYNPNIPNGQLCMSEVFDGVRLIETSNRNISEVTNTVVKKMGFSEYSSSLQKHLGTAEKETTFLKTLDETNLRYMLGNIKKSGSSKQAKELYSGQLKSLEQNKSYYDANFFELAKKELTEYIKLCDLGIAEKYSEKLDIFPKAWEKYCSKSGYVSNLHSQSPWAKAEFGVTFTDALVQLKKPWGTHKEQIIGLFDDALKSLPKNKEMGFDIASMKKIILESDTPQVAKERLAKELNIKTLPSRKKESIKKELSDAEIDSFFSYYLSALYAK